METKGILNTNIEQNEELKEVIQIPNSPFWAIRKGNEGWLLVMGNEMMYKNTFETYEQLVTIVEEKPWELIVKAAYTFNKAVDKIGNETTDDIQSGRDGGGNRLDGIEEDKAKNSEYDQQT